MERKRNRMETEGNLWTAHTSARRPGELHPCPGKTRVQGSAPAIVAREPVEQIEEIYDDAGCKVREELGKTTLTTTMSIWKSGAMKACPCAIPASPAFGLRVGLFSAVGCLILREEVEDVQVIRLSSSHAE